ncbi:unnamed protein product, partial [Didymodactylos carnosus]
ILRYGSDEIAGHFLLHFTSIRIMHYYDRIEDVDQIEPLLDRYREECSSISGQISDLYTIYAHNYLPNQFQEEAVYK